MTEAMSTDISSGLLSKQVSIGSVSCYWLSSHVITIKDQWFGSDMRFTQSQVTHRFPIRHAHHFASGKPVPLSYIETMLNSESCSTAITLSG
jgi:hypothetical protein